MSSYTSTSEYGRRIRYGRHFAAAGIACVLVLGAAAAVNWWIDPFNTLGRNWIGIYAASERDAKPVMLRGRDYRGIILGSSKTTYIDPLQLDAPGFFNASFPGAVPEEMLNFVRWHATDQQVVLIGLDLFMFNEREVPLRPESLAPDNTYFGTARYVLSASVLMAALRDGLKHMDGDPPRLAAAGNRTAVERMARHRNMSGTDYETALEKLEKHHFADFDYSTRRVEILKEMRALMEARGIRYGVFLNPLNREVLDLLRSLPAWHEFERFRRDVRRIFPEAVDLTESEWSDPEMYFRFDPYHYLPEFGANFVNRAVLPALPGRQSLEAGAGSSRSENRSR